MSMIRAAKDEGEPFFIYLSSMQLCVTDRIYVYTYNTDLPVVSHVDDTCFT